LRGGSRRAISTAIDEEEVRAALDEPTLELASEPQRLGELDRAPLPAGGEGLSLELEA